MILLSLALVYVICVSCWWLNLLNEGSGGHCREALKEFWYNLKYIIYIYPKCIIFGCELNECTGGCRRCNTCSQYLFLRRPFIVWIHWTAWYSFFPLLGYLATRYHKLKKGNKC